MSNQILVAVDMGRSQIKSVSFYTDNTDKSYECRFIFRSMYSYFSLIYPQQSFSRQMDDIICQIDSLPACLFGEVCLSASKSNNLIYGLNNSLFIKEYSFLYIMVSIAKLLEMQSLNNLKVILGISYTNDNCSYINELKQKLIGNHSVIIQNIAGKELSKIEFDIIEIHKYLQPIPIIYNIMIQPDFTIRKSDMYKKILILDSGSFTFDSAVISSLKIQQSNTIPIGANTIYESISNELSKIGVNLNVKEIEDRHIHNKTVANRIKNNVCIKEYFDSLLPIYAKKVVNDIINQYEDYSFEDIYITGGASEYFYSFIKEVFDNIKFTDDKIFSNATGILKSLRRKLLSNNNEIRISDG